MILKPFEIEDLDRINFSVEYNELESKEQAIELFDTMNDESIFATFVDDGKVVAISGIKHIHGDVGEAFNIRTENLEARHIKEIKKNLHEAAKMFDRVHTVSNPKWDRWHEALGFEKEATMRKFMHGEDYNLWVIINEGG